VIPIGTYVPSISIRISITSRRLRTIIVVVVVVDTKIQAAARKSQHHVSSEDTSRFPKNKEETGNLAAAPALRPVLIIYRLLIK
jgi:hypothetical protein